MGTTGIGSDVVIGAVAVGGVVVGAVAAGAVGACVVAGGVVTGGVVLFGGGAAGCCARAWGEIDAIAATDAAEDRTRTNCAIRREWIIWARTVQAHQ
jgi:hypothetical protein